MKLILLLIACASFLSGKGQTPDSIWSSSIATPQLFMACNQTGYPVIRLNSADQLELHFDDLDANVKNYFYTYQLCNSDWTPAQVSEFDFIKGFSQVRIGNYQFSSVALTRYTHYQALVPDPNCIPIHSGNFLLKVFLDGDTSKLAFTCRFLVTDQKASIRSQLLEPMNYEQAHSHQRIQFRVNASGVNPTDPLQQIRVVVLQNYRWDNAIRDVRPTFYSNNNLEYTNDNDFVFPGGMEWRWVDLQSFRFQSDRIQTVNYGKSSTEIILKPDGDRSRQPYYNYKDYNGFYFIRTTESINPLWQTDYARVRFTYSPPGNIPFPDKEVYLFGQLTGNMLSEAGRMSFNAIRGRYESSCFLKQGYYSYAYVTVDRNDPAARASFEFTEGNHLETENDYTILVYYRALGARADELVGIQNFNSLNKRL